MRSLLPFVPVSAATEACLFHFEVDVNVLYSANIQDPPLSTTVNFTPPFLSFFAFAVSCASVVLLYIDVFLASDSDIIVVAE